MSSFEELQNFIHRLPDKVQKNIKIVEPSQLPSPFLIHITKDRPNSYTPRIGFRQANMEDRTTPRITAATTLYGAIIGYAVLPYDVLEFGYKGKDSNWKGGLYINAIPFEYALKPNTRLVYDVRASNEHWLVTYNAQTRYYIPEQIGKLFVSELKALPQINQEPKYVITVKVEVKKSFYFDLVNVLNPGYYEITFDYNRNSTWDMFKTTKIKEIAKSDFLKEKLLVTANLSIENKPIYGRW